MMKAELDKAATLAEPSAPAPAVLRAHPQQGLATGGPPIDGRPWHADRVGWFLVGGGAVGVLAGGGLLLNASSLYDQASEEDIQSMAADLRSRGRNRAIVGGILGGVGLGVAVVGVIRLASTSDPDARPTSFQVTVGPTSFLVRGSF